MEYDVYYFIDKFSNIDDKYWVCDTYSSDNDGGKNLYACAMGHCNFDGDSNLDENEEALALAKIAQNYLGLKSQLFGEGAITVINDSKTYRRELYNTHKLAKDDIVGDTPKERILNFLGRVEESEGRGEEAIESAKQTLNKTEQTLNNLETLKENKCQLKETKEQKVLSKANV